MIGRHDEVWAQWDRLAKLDEDDPRIGALSDECSRLEPAIIATPAYTKAGLADKRRLIAKVGYASVNGSKDLATDDVGDWSRPSSPSMQGASPRPS
jgi:hypothetical protein